jgi:hypothetical protein
MENAKEVFIPDEIWYVFVGCQTFEGYCATLVPEFNLHENVPEAVQRKIAIIKKLLLHAYYEYGFIDVASLQTYLALELALNIKYNSLNPGKKNKLTLWNLLEWAISKNVVSPKEGIIESITFLRNHKMHPKEESISGVVSLNSIKYVCNSLINEIYNK